MGPEKRSRLPVPPSATPSEVSKSSIAPTKTGIPSPRRRTTGGLSRLKDLATSAAVASTLSTTTAGATKRPTQAPISKITKPLLRPGSSHFCDEKDDVRQRDSSLKDSKRDSLIQRDKAPRESGIRRFTPISENSSQPDLGKRLLKQPSLLLKSSIATPSAAQPSTCSAKPSVTTSVPAAAAPAASAAAVAAAAGKQATRSISTCRDRLCNDTRTSMMRRSMSVGKGRALMTPVPDQFPQQAGAKQRPVMERPASAAGAPHRSLADRPEASAGRIRPISAGGKLDHAAPSSGKFTLKPIAEVPARPTAQASAVTATATVPARPASFKPMFSLNLAALKQQQPAAPEPGPVPLSAPPAPSSTGAAPSSTPPAPPATQATPVDTAVLAVSNPAEDSGPPVPKLDLGGILQRRAEEQASEPVFVVAASSEDTGQVSATASHHGAVDKRKSGSRQASAKEEPAEHFYLYPKVQPQEKKRIDDICRVVPRKQQAAITDLFSKMVEARQNCEQMCFRGHRLLDQAQAEFRNRLAMKEEEVVQTREEAAQWRQEAEYLRSQLALLLGGARPADEDAEASEAHNDAGSSADDRVAFLRSSLMATFDRMAMLGGAAARSIGSEAQTDAYSASSLSEAYGGEAEGRGGEAQPDAEASPVRCDGAAFVEEYQGEGQSDEGNGGQEAE